MVPDTTIIANSQNPQNIDSALRVPRVLRLIFVVEQLRSIIVITPLVRKAV